MRLWEADHSYYPAERAWNEREGPCQFRSWSDFLDGYGGADEDYNTVIRWDWYEGDGEESNYTGDDYYRNGTLMIGIFHQRKGFYQRCDVDVCRADEPAVREYLEGRWAYMKALWVPVNKT